MKDNDVSNKIHEPTIADFKVIKPISRGAYGKVFLAHKQNDTNKIFAIKVMKKEELRKKNVVKERDALAVSNSPFIVKLFYSFPSPSNIFLVMEYMIGGDLKSLLETIFIFTESMAKFYAAEISLALEYLHKHGIVHRDIKPDNILLSQSGHIKLTDFGLVQTTWKNAPKEKDLMMNTPSENYYQYMDIRTPTQIKSLTSTLYTPKNETPATMLESPYLYSLKLAQADILGVGHKLPYLSPEESRSSTLLGSEASTTILQTPLGRAITGSPNLRPKIRKISYGDINDQENLKMSQKNVIVKERGIDYIQLSEITASSSVDDSEGTIKDSFSSPVKSYRLKRAISPIRGNTNLTAEISSLTLGSCSKRFKLTSSTVKYSGCAEMNDKENGVVSKRELLRNCDQMSVDKCVVMDYSQRVLHGSLKRDNAPALTFGALGTAPSSPIYPTKKASKVTFKTPENKTYEFPAETGIMGTPDYLAPELLQHLKHGFEVDWWALGVCIYEFLLGFPPFSGSTVQEVFNNILERNLSWPDEDDTLHVSKEAKEIVERILDLDPSKRPDSKVIKNFEFFKDVPWEDFLKTKPPFVPTPDNLTDTGYFETRNIAQNINVSNFEETL